MVLTLIFEYSFSFSCYKPSKFEMAAWTKKDWKICALVPQKVRAWAVTSLEININSPSRNSKEDTVHFLQDSSDD